MGVHNGREMVPVEHKPQTRGSGKPVPTKNEYNFWERHHLQVHQGPSMALLSTPGYSFVAGSGLEHRFRGGLAEQEVKCAIMLVIRPHPPSDHE